MSQRLIGSAVVLAILGLWPLQTGAETTQGKRGLLAPGSPAPTFALPDVVSGATVSLDGFAGRDALLVMFLCRHCPYVQHVKDGVAQLARDYSGTRVGIVAVSANDAGAYPQDGPEGLKAMAHEAGFTFPYLYDATQAVAKAYTAVCTPDFFLFDRARRLVYRGQFDDSRPGNGTPVTGQDVRAAIDALLAGTTVASAHKPSFGCSIKWKSGNEPAYSR